MNQKFVEISQRRLIFTQCKVEFVNAKANGIPYAYGAFNWYWISSLNNIDDEFDQLQYQL